MTPTPEIALPLIDQLQAENRQLREAGKGTVDD